MDVDRRSTTINIDNKLIELQVWDTAEQASRSVTRFLYSGTAGVLLVYDTTKRETISYLARSLKDAKEHANADATIVLVGDKSDLEHERGVGVEEGERFAKENGLMFMELSAKIDQDGSDGLWSQAGRYCAIL